MNIELCSEAQEFGVQAGRALTAAGGDELVQRAEQDPEVRRSVVAEVLGGLGAWDLAPRRDVVELEAAAALCRSAGYLAVPYPVAERLARPEESGVDGLLVVSEVRPAAPVADLDLRWAAVTVDGVRRNVAVRPSDSSPRTSMFVAELEVGAPIEGVGETADPALALVLPCWTLLGMLDRAVDLARAHVLVREQFGQPLAQFQGVQFQLTDAEVERRGVEMLARYALWSIGSGDPAALADALSLRLAALEAADTVFRVAHQLHGALGFCDESPLSWVSRYSQPIRRLPFGRTTTEELLGDGLGRRGLSGLFSDPMGV
ncbi:acyl-CoA dehydrogenase family protein [Nocardia jiangxiensis]|uniref:Acyl-CoA dehydrogenase family protein n=1 Tax=Nocardia jiangxiensis TaxID=282685 RepID=A0ABW6RVI4_9NOCA|nr:acyl-CoA dehydrogenase family protein [Nocardia jiangxiensis]